MYSIHFFHLFLSLAELHFLRRFPTNTIFVLIFFYYIPSDCPIVIHLMRCSIEIHSLTVVCALCGHHIVFFFDIPAFFIFHYTPRPLHHFIYILTISISIVLLRLTPTNHLLLICAFNPTMNTQNDGKNEDLNVGIVLQWFTSALRKLVFYYFLSY